VKALRSPRDILATDQMCQIGKLCRPGKLLQNAAQKQQAADVDGRRRIGIRRRGNPRSIAAIERMIPVVPGLTEADQVGAF